MHKQPTEQEQPAQRKPFSRKEEVEYTAMLAISVTLLQACISTNRDLAILISTACFALAIPILTITLHQQFQNTEPIPGLNTIGNTGNGLAFIGLTFIIAHVSPLATSLFLLSGMAYITFLSLIHLKRKKNV